MCLFSYHMRLDEIFWNIWKSFSGNILILHENYGCLLDDGFCLQSLEGRDRNKLCQSVKLFIRIFVFVTLSRESDSYSGRRVLDSSSPDVLVQSSVNSDIFGSHGLLCKLLDFLDSSWGTALVLDTVNKLGKVDCVVPGNQIRFGCSCLCHFGYVSMYSNLQTTMDGPARNAKAQDV